MILYNGDAPLPLTKLLDGMISVGMEGESGWAIDQESPEGYYNRQTLYTQHFIAPRDYLWPIKEQDIIVNPNLVQNPGW